MVLGTAKRTSECQYSVKVELWHSEESRVSECHKTPLRELWSSEKGKKPTELVLVGFEPCMANLSQVQSAKNTADCQRVKIPISDTIGAMFILPSKKQENG
jgi:hypothetical protein